MLKRKPKTTTEKMREQAEEVMERLAPHMESAKEKAAPYVADAKVKASEAREKAAATRGAAFGPGAMGGDGEGEFDPSTMELPPGFEKFLGGR